MFRPGTIHRLAKTVTNLDIGSQASVELGALVAGKLAILKNRAMHVAVTNKRKGISKYDIEVGADLACISKTFFGTKVGAENVLPTASTVKIFKGKQSDLHLSKDAKEVLPLIATAILHDYVKKAERAAIANGRKTILTKDVFIFA